MPTVAQAATKNADPFTCLVWALADHFPERTDISVEELPDLTNADIRVVVHYDTGAFNKDELLDEADVLNCVLYPTHEAQIVALGQYRRDFLNYQAREYLRNEVNAELDRRLQRYGSARSEAKWQEQYL